MRVPVPFLRRPIGAGDAIEAVTSAVGIKPCSGCLQRAQKANALQFVPRASEWTTPPHAPEGWQMVAEKPTAMMFRNADKLIVWSIRDGQYSNSHQFCCTERSAQLAEDEFKCR